MVKVRDLIPCRDRDQEQDQIVTVQMGLKDGIIGHVIGGGQHLNPLLNLLRGGDRQDPLQGRPGKVENDMYIPNTHYVHENQSPFDYVVSPFSFCVLMPAKKPTPYPTDFPSYVPTEPPTLQPTPRPS